MKLKSIKSWQIVCASLLLLAASYGIVRACAGGDWDESYSSNYTPEVFVADTTQTPFFYTWLFYYQIGFDTEHNERFNSTNVADWSKYLKGSVDKPSLEYLLNKANSKAIGQLVAFFDGKVLPDSLKRKAKGISRSNPLHKDFIHYLMYAKKCEQYAVYYNYYWDDKRTLPSRSDMGNIEESLRNGFEKSSDQFLKERYWFQLVRYYYFYDWDRCTYTFESNKLKFSPSTMYYRAMSYAAGAYYAMDRYVIANYYYSRIYDGCNQLKVVAHSSFHPQNESDWQQTLELCQNNEERITLWHLLGINYADEVRSMKEIYKLSSYSTKLDLLLTRFVNKQEIGTPYSQNTDSAKKAIEQDIRWCQQVANEGKTSNPFLWDVSAGYLSFLVGDYQKSAHYYQKAAKGTPNNDLAKSQLRLLTLLTNIKLLPKITPANEQSLLADLQWLYKLSYKSIDTRFRYYNAQSWVKKELAQKYEAQGDAVKAECFSSSTAFYSSNSNIEKMKAYFQNAKPNAYDKFCMGMSEKKLVDLWEYQAIRAAYSDSLSNAIALMQNVGETSTLLGNPFIGRKNDCHDCDHMAPQKVKYTKMSFLKKMKDLETAVAAGTNVHANAFMLGNAFYNMSHYGNARAFYEGGVITAGQSSPYYIPTEFAAMLTSNKMAMKYYQIAFKGATNNEQKAKCLFMMAKCERNEWYNTTLYSNRENEYNYDSNSPDFIQWNSFKLLKGYKNTKFYKEIINECGYFRKSVVG